MGLDISHDCWHGAYSAFMRWRAKLAEVSGYGDILKRVGFGGNIEWPKNDPLVILLHHSDYDGEIKLEDCLPLAERLEELLPALKIAGDGNFHIGSYFDKTQIFIDGLRKAAKLKEDVKFY